MALLLQNAVVWDGAAFIQRDLAITQGRIVDRPDNHTRVVDLAGLALFPALINAHDHLELNHYGRLRYRECYANAHEWGEDVNARLDSPPLRDLRTHPLRDRLLIGGLKNLLCGALTVAHHNPPRRPLFQKGYPVRVLHRYGWAHSLHFTNMDEIRRSHRKTPCDAPWMIHLAEGTDKTAAGEYARLKALGCDTVNTIIIHGVGLTAEDITDAAPRLRGLITCPSTNRYLLDAAAPLTAWLEVGGRAALGSDSRLTADGDMLDELRALLREQPAFSAQRALAAATTDAAALLGLSDCGQLRSGARADLIAIRANGDPLRALINAHRADLTLVLREGAPLIGDPDVFARFSHKSVSAVLNGRPKLIAADLAQKIARSNLQEPGLVVHPPPARRWFLR